MVIDELYTVHLAFSELCTQLHGNVNALANIRMVYQISKITLNVVTQLASLISHLAAYGVDFDTTRTQLFRVGGNSLLHHLDDIGIETAAKR